MKVTLKDKKDVIFNEYKKSLDRIKELEEGKVNIEADVQKKADAKTLDTCKEVINLGILNNEIVEKFNSVVEAIELKEEELKELYLIEKEAQTLTALINANIDRRKENEVNLKELEELYKKKVMFLENSYEEMDKELQSKYNAKEKELKNKLVDKEAEQRKLREREEEEYLYSLERERERENNAWKDEKELREKELSKKEAIVKEREEKINILEDEISDLKDIVNDIPNQIEKAKKETEAITKNKLTSKHEAEKELIQKEAQWEKDKSDEKIKDLELQLSKANSKISELEDNLKCAYREMREMATEAVKSSGVRVVEHQKLDK